MLTIIRKRRFTSRLICLVTASFFFLNIFTSDVLALAPELRSKPFSESTRLEFQKVYEMMLTAGRLKGLIEKDDARPGNMARLNNELKERFPNGEVEMVPELRNGALSTGRGYKYTVFHFKKENRSIEARFFKDDDNLTDKEREELGVKTDEDKRHFFDSQEHLALKGVWFVGIAQDRERGAQDAARVRARFEELAKVYGGKGAWTIILNELKAKIGYETPDPTYITIPQVWAKFIEANRGLVEEGNDLIRKQGSAAGPETKVRLRKLRERFVFPEELAREIDRLAPDTKGALICRSSGSFEDSFVRNLAGVFISPVAKDRRLLAQAMKEAFLQAMEVIWARGKGLSTLTVSEAGQAWNNLKDLPVTLSAEEGFGAVVQPFLEFDASGTAMSNFYGHTAIEAAIGDARTAVSSVRASVASYLFKKGDATFEYNPAYLDLPHTFKLKGVEYSVEKSRDEMRRALAEYPQIDGKPSPLSPAQAQELNRVVNALEEAIGVPVDVEWGILNNKLYILQARPIIGDFRKALVEPAPELAAHDAISRTPIALGQTSREGITANVVLFGSGVKADDIRAFENEIGDGYIRVESDVASTVGVLDIGNKARVLVDPYQGPRNAHSINRITGRIAAGEFVYCNGPALREGLLQHLDLIPHPQYNNIWVSRQKVTYFSDGLRGAFYASDAPADVKDLVTDRQDELADFHERMKPLWLKHLDEIGYYKGLWELLSKNIFATAGDDAFGIMVYGDNAPSVDALRRTLVDAIQRGGIPEDGGFAVQPEIRRLKEALSNPLYPERGESRIRAILDRILRLEDVAARQSSPVQTQVQFAPVQKPEKPTSARILLIDDDAIQTNLIRKWFDEMWGKEYALSVANFIEDVDKAEIADFDLVIYDCAMPRLGEIKDALKKAKQLVLLTAYNMRDAKQNLADNELLNHSEFINKAESDYIKKMKDVIRGSRNAQLKGYDEQLQAWNAAQAQSQPTPSAAAHPKTVPPAEVRMPDKPTVFIIQNASAQAEDLAEYIRESSGSPYNIITADSVFMLERSMREHTPDVVIVDPDLDDKDELDHVISLIAAKNPECRFIITGKNAAIISRERLTAKNILGILETPFHFAGAKDLLLKYLAGKFGAGKHEEIGDVSKRDTRPGGASPSDTSPAPEYASAGGAEGPAVASATVSGASGAGFDIALNLLPTILCDSAHPLIIAAARSIIRGCRTDEEMARKLVLWIKENIEFAIGYGAYWDAKATLTLETRKGMCFNQANLLIAMARSLGIPAEYTVVMIKVEQFEKLLDQAMIRQIKVIGSALHVLARLWIGGRWMQADPMYSDSNGPMLFKNSPSIKHAIPGRPAISIPNMDTRALSKGSVYTRKERDLAEDSRRKYVQERESSRPVAPNITVGEDPDEIGDVSKRDTQPGGVPPSDTSPESPERVAQGVKAEDGRVSLNASLDMEKAATAARVSPAGMAPRLNQSIAAEQEGAVPAIPASGDPLDKKIEDMARRSLKEVSDYLAALDAALNRKEIRIIIKKMVELARDTTCLPCCINHDLIKLTVVRACAQYHELIRVIADMVFVALSRPGDERFSLDKQILAEIVMQLDWLAMKTPGMPRITQLIVQGHGGKAVIDEIRRCFRIWTAATEHDALNTLPSSDIVLSGKDGITLSSFDRGWYYIERYGEPVGTLHAFLPKDGNTLWKNMHIFQRARRGAGAAVMRWLAAQAGAGNYIEYFGEPNPAHASFFIRSMRSGIFDLVEVGEGSPGMESGRSWRAVEDPDEFTRIAQGGSRLKLRGRVAKTGTDADLKAEGAEKNDSDPISAASKPVAQSMAAGKTGAAPIIGIDIDVTDTSIQFGPGRGSPADCLDALMSYFGDRLRDGGTTFSAGELIGFDLRKKEDGSDFALLTVKLELRILHKIGVFELANGSRPYRYRLRSDIRNLLPPQIQALLEKIRNFDELKSYDVPKDVRASLNARVSRMVREASGEGLRAEGVAQSAERMAQGGKAEPPPNTTQAAKIELSPTPADTVLLQRVHSSKGDLEIRRLYPEDIQKLRPQIMSMIKKHFDAEWAEQDIGKALASPNNITAAVFNKSGEMVGVSVGVGGPIDLEMTTTLNNTTFLWAICVMDEQYKGSGLGGKVLPELFMRLAKEAGYDTWICFVQIPGMIRALKNIRSFTLLREEPDEESAEWTKFTFDLHSRKESRDGAISGAKGGESMAQRAESREQSASRAAGTDVESQREPSPATAQTTTAPAPITLAEYLSAHYPELVKLVRNPITGRMPLVMHAINQNKVAYISTMKNPAGSLLSGLVDILTQGLKSLKESGLSWSSAELWGMSFQSDKVSLYEIQDAENSHVQLAWGEINVLVRSDLLPDYVQAGREVAAPEVWTTSVPPEAIIAFVIPSYPLHAAEADVSVLISAMEEAKKIDPKFAKPIFNKNLAMIYQPEKSNLVRENELAADSERETGDGPQSVAPQAQAQPPSVEVSPARMVPIGTERVAQGVKAEDGRVSPSGMAPRLKELTTAAEERAKSKEQRVSGGKGVGPVFQISPGLRKTVESHKGAGFFIDVTRIKAKGADIWYCQPPVGGNFTVIGYETPEGPRYTLVDTGIGAYFDETIAWFENNGIDPSRVEQILMTHAHADHTGAVGLWQKKFHDIKVFAHPAWRETVSGLELSDNPLGRSAAAALKAVTGYGEPVRPFEPYDLDSASDVKVGRHSYRAWPDLFHLGGITLTAVSFPFHSGDSVIYIGDREDGGKFVITGEPVGAQESVMSGERFMFFTAMGDLYGGERVHLVGGTEVMKANLDIQRQADVTLHLCGHGDAREALVTDGKRGAWNTLTKETVKLQSFEPGTTDNAYAAARSELRTEMERQRAAGSGIDIDMIALGEKYGLSQDELTELAKEVHPGQGAGTKMSPMERAKAIMQAISEFRHDIITILADYPEETTGIIQLRKILQNVLVHVPRGDTVIETEKEARHIWARGEFAATSLIEWNQKYSVGEIISSIPSKRKVDKTRLTRQAERIKRMIREVEGVSKNTSYIPRSESININEIINDELSSTRMIESRKYGWSVIKKRAHLDSHLPSLTGDRALLGRAIMNIIANAADALDNVDDPTLAVRTRYDKRSDQVVVIISDNGCGIPKNDLNKIFAPYFTTKATGTGLGLAITKRAVDDMGGTIEVQSQLGKGTTFTIRLPVTAAYNKALVEARAQLAATGEVDLAALGKKHGLTEAQLTELAKEVHPGQGMDGPGVRSGISPEGASGESNHVRNSRLPVAAAAGAEKGTVPIPLAVPVKFNRKGAVILNPHSQELADQLRRWQKLIAEIIIPFLKKYKFVELYAIGSFAKGELSGESDIDLSAKTNETSTVSCSSFEIDLLEVQSKLETLTGANIDFGAGVKIFLTGGPKIKLDLGQIERDPDYLIKIYLAGFKPESPAISGTIPQKDALQGEGGSAEPAAAQAQAAGEAYAQALADACAELAKTGEVDMVALGKKHGLTEAQLTELAKEVHPGQGMEAEGIANRPRAEYNQTGAPSGSGFRETASDFYRQISQVVAVDKLEFSRSSRSSQEDVVTIGGPVMQGWENTDLYLSSLNPDGMGHTYKESAFRQPSLVLPRDYVMDKRIRDLVVELVRTGIIEVNLSEHSAFATTDAVVAILNDALIMAKTAKAAGVEAIGTMGLTWIEEVKSIIVPDVSTAPRMGYVLHPHIIFWPKYGIGAAGETPRELLKTLASPGSEFIDDAVPSATAMVVPFSLSRATAFEDYARVMQRISHMAHRLLPGVDLQPRFSDDQLLPIPQSFPNDTKPEDLDLHGAMNLEQPMGYAESKIAQSLKAETDSVPGFSLQYIVLATLKGKDENELFTIGGKKTGFICRDDEVLVVHRPIFSAIHYLSFGEGDDIFQQAVDAVVRFKIQTRKALNTAPLPELALLSGETVAENGAIPERDTLQAQDKAKPASSDMGGKRAEAVIGPDDSGKIVIDRRDAVLDFRTVPLEMLLALLGYAVTTAMLKDLGPGTYRAWEAHFKQTLARQPTWAEDLVGEIARRLQVSIPEELARLKGIALIHAMNLYEDKHALLKTLENKATERFAAMPMEPILSMDQLQPWDVVWKDGMVKIVASIQNNADPEEAFIVFDNFRGSSSDFDGNELAGSGWKKVNTDEKMGGVLPPVAPARLADSDYGREERVKIIEPGAGRLDLGAIFGNDNPVTVEIGYGGAELLAAESKARSDRNYVGIDFHYPAEKHAATLGIGDNARFIKGNGRYILDENFADNSLDEILIIFPSPENVQDQPESLKEYDYRLFKPGFADIFFRKLKPGGRLVVVSESGSMKKNVWREIQRAPGLSDRKFTPLKFTDDPAKVIGISLEASGTYRRYRDEKDGEPGPDHYYAIVATKASGEKPSQPAAAPAPASHAGAPLGSVPGAAVMQSRSNKTSDAESEIREEADRIYQESLAITPSIPDKTIICHVVTESILPAGQRGMLRTLEQEMRDEKYGEKVVSLQAADSATPEEFMAKLEALKANIESRYAGYTVQFDVACPKQEYVANIQKLNMQALAFRREGDGEIVQVQGIILALRALRTGSVASLLGAFKAITGRDYTAGSADISELARMMLFILPVRKLDINRMGTINRLIEENIKKAA